MKKIFGCLVAVMFLMMAIPQVQAVETEEDSNNNFFGFCYFENSAPSTNGPAKKTPYMGGVTILGGGSEDSVTKVYKRKGGEEIGCFEGSQTVFVFLMIGSHEYTGTERIFCGRAIGVYVNMI